jgi:Predicted transcriptional regulators
MSNCKDIVANNIKKLREHFGYTQDYLAKKIDVGRSAYANYESGEREFPHEIINRLSSIFGCEPYMLFDESFSIHNDVLVCAFRMSDFNESDFEEICRFKDIVRNYIKMKRLIDE